MNLLKKISTVTPIAMAVALSFSAVEAAAKADLIPVTNVFGVGKVGIKNIGDTESRVTWLTIKCLAATGCPEHPEMNSYENPKFPNAVAIKVPALKAGASYSHQLTFWSKLKFEPGQYKFLILSDAGNDIPESNELNNKVHFIKNVNKANNKFTSTNKLGNKKPSFQTMKASGKKVSFKQLPIVAQRAVENSFNLQVKGKKQSNSCATTTPKRAGNFTQEVQVSGWPECVIDDGVFGCIFNYRWTGCVDMGDGQWECDWDSQNIPPIC